jgi:hypothetical protein
MIHQTTDPSSYPVIHGRKELSHTTLDKTTAISEVYENQFR